MSKARNIKPEQRKAMNKRTIASAHDRIDSLEKEIIAIKTEVKIQFKDLFTRVKRMEGIMIATTGSIIALLLAVLTKMGQRLAVAVLETIAAANAAYSVIKRCLENGNEVKGLVGQVGKFLTAEDDLKDAVRRKKNNPITSITGGSEGDWEEFQALEDIKEKRRELESWCRLYGPPGTWDRWQQYQAEARKARRAAQKQKEKEREELVELMMYSLAGLLAVVGMVGLVAMVGRYMEKW